jgi:small-conductance mechanosensitive channel
MNDNRYIFLGIIVFFLLTFYLTTIGFSQITELKDTPVTEPKPLEMVQMPDYAKSSMSLIKDIRDIVDKQEKINEILPGLGDVLSVLDKKDSILSDTLNIYRLDDLDKEDRELALLNQRILQWKTIVQNFKKNAQYKDSVLSSMSQIWQITLDSINTAEKKSAADKSSNEKSDNIKTEIVGLLSDLHTSQNDLHAYLESIQNIQTEITIAESKLGNISNLIDSRRTRLKQSIWMPDYPPVWEVKKDTVEVNPTERLLNFIDTDTNIIRAFMKNNPILPYYFGFFILLVFGTLLYIRPKADALYADFQEEFKEATILLKIPLFSTLIIAWFCFTWFSFIPRELKDFMALLMFLPTVIVVRKLNPNWKWYAVLIFSCSFLLFLIIKEFDYSQLGQRIFLILLNLFTIILFLYLRAKRVLIDQSDRFLSTAYALIINLFIGAGFISLVAGVLGSIQLAQVLSYTALGVIVVLYVLRTVILLIHSLVFLVLMGPLLKHSYILKEDGRLVLFKMDKVLKIVGVGFLVFIILEMLNIREESLNAVSAFINYPLEVGEMSISLAAILAFFITIQIAIWISTLLRYILEKEVFPRSSLKQGVPNTILLMIKFTVTLLGILLAFSAAGIHMDKLAIAMGALGVGIGFGLQNIISNFISGIILALERPITIGDLIEIPEVSGVVRDIGIRASIVRTWDGSDVVVPNAELIANKLTNWTFYDRLRRVKVDVRVPFDADTEAVSKLLLKIADNVPEVMKKPAPYLNFKGIGTSAMEITLYCWINDSDKIFSYGTAIREAVYKGLKEAGYEMPIPRQELKIDDEKTQPNN